MTIPLGYCQATIGFQTPATLGSKPVVVLGFSMGDGTLDDVKDALDNAITSEFNESFSPPYTPLLITLRTDTHELVWQPALTSSTATEESTPSTSVLVRKGTALIGRKNRGRSYWPGLLVDSQVDAAGKILSTEVAGIQGAMTGFAELMVDAGFPMVILHTDNTTPTPVISYTVEETVATQRRRLRR